MSGDIDGVIVVVPARNEELLLPRCLAALERAVRRVDVPVRVQLVLDACTDGSAQVASTAEVLTVSERNVGAARRRGFEHAGAACDGRTWFATTDADSEVEESWLSAQLDYARRGFEVVAGVVAVRQWDAHSVQARRIYEHEYRVPGPDGHGHLHGAALGFRADAYWGVGGFRALRTGEDVDLAVRLQAAGARIAWAEDVCVTTSARRRGRAPHGFAEHLRRLGRDEPQEVS
ncbi:glycosyltransferase [Nocardia salmonicida]|uniref:glycosyltransferase n=1 Tax=Nocardia salmonicida TaxID=53431 RepID=UPI002E2C3DF8|nr:glycosyltransferase [Nocardia salmonicida]